MILDKSLSSKHVSIVEAIVVAVFALAPIAMDFPFRVNIFVTYEGAYRMYLGQFPFKDFGLPLGYGYWIIPWLFFEVLGPKIHTLVIAQAFVNVISLVAFSGILRLFKVGDVQRLLAIFLFCLTYVLVNFWPWYNHSVFVFELVGLYFLLRYIVGNKSVLWLIPSALMMALSLFTKQDTGAFGLLLCGAFLLIAGISNRSIKGIGVFGLSYVVSLCIFILPLLAYDFGYWFNYGQPPHFSRINLHDFLTAIFMESGWLKFYLIAAIIVIALRLRTFSEWKSDMPFVYFALFTLGILIQAMFIQVTSFSPATATHYYHAFGIVFLLQALSPVIRFERLGIAVGLMLLLFIWRSENTWKYSMKVLGKVLPSIFAPPPSNVVSKNTWSSKSDETGGEPIEWGYTSLRSFRKIKLPQQTIEGIDHIMNLPIVKERGSSLQCLNMSNLTSLAYELNYVPEADPHFPLWYHKGVALFDREVSMLCDKIADQQYDLVVFESMPDVDSFFPFEVQQCLKENYQLVNTFQSPTGYLTDHIEVYIRNSGP